MVDEEGEQRSVLEVRINQLQALMESIDTIFSRFIDLRIQQNWDEKGLGTIKKWIDNKVVPTQTIQ